MPGPDPSSVTGRGSPVAGRSADRSRAAVAASAAGAVIVVHASSGNSPGADRAVTGRGSSMGVVIPAVPFDGPVSRGHPPYICRYFG